MNMMKSIEMRRCDARVEMIRAEFGAVMAARIMEAEALDFLWEARVSERYLGQHVGAIDDDEDRFEDISRIAFLSHLDGEWHAGICLMDGDGNSIDLLWKRRFESILEARLAFDRAC